MSDSGLTGSDSTGVPGPRSGGASNAGSQPLSSGARENQSRPRSKFPRDFGRYRLEREIGQGAMGVVYLAEDTQLQRRVALKIPKKSLMEDRDALARFYREAHTTARLRHNNICPVYDVGEIDGVHYLTMAHIKGTSVDRFVKNGKLQSSRQIATLIRKIALALEEAHQNGVIHRDLKPSNVMLDDRGEPIVMDFGLACQVNTEQNARITQSGAILGTPAYMSPEQVRGDQKNVGPASDIFALGVMLYEFLTRELPFRGPLITVLTQVLSAEPPRPSDIRSDVDLTLEAICLKMMSKEIPSRFQSMRDVARALTEYLKTGKVAGLETTAVARETQSATTADTHFDGEALPVRSASLRRRKSKPKPKASKTQDSKGGRFILAAAGGVLFVIVATVAWMGGFKSRPAAPQNNDRNTLETRSSAQSGLPVQAQPETKPATNGPIGLVVKCPFNGDARNEAPGKATWELKNTEFRDGALYLNGIYESSESNKGYRAVCLTPDLLSRQSVGATIAFRFKAESFQQSGGTTIFVGGASFRWIWIERADSGNLSVTIGGNRQEFAKAPLKLDTWHSLVCTIDRQREDITLILDGEPLPPMTIPFNSKLEGFGTDNAWCFANYGNGRCFHGLIDEFRLYNRPMRYEELSDWFGTTNNAPSISREAKDADRKRLLEIGQAMHAYVRQQGKFPPADMSLLGTHGQLSWRVGLLPYLGQQELYQKFNIQESWDSPHNLDLVKQMPDVYQSSGSILPAGRTNIVAPLGQGTTFDPRYRVGLRDVTDGTSNVAMLLRADASQAVIWTSPNDLQIDWNRPLGTLANQPGGEVPLLMVDGAVLYAPYVISPEMFRGLLKINDGGMIDLNSLKK